MNWGPWSHPGYAEVLALVEERAGLVPPSCPASAEEGIARAMSRAGVKDFDAYRLRLVDDPAALDDLLIELTVGETYFFRTPEHFEHLRGVVLPDLRERHGPGHTARLWSAACSSGEEPYSIAALLMTEGWEQHMAVYATDVSRGALARARKAQYGDWSLRGGWADRMRIHLRAEGRRYLLSPEVQKQVRFSYLNLALDTWPSPESGIWKLDVIFCRNVLIYFNRPTIEAVARRLHDALDEGGYLFTGPSDPPLGGLAPLESVLTEWGVLYRRPLHGVSLSVPFPSAVPSAWAEPTGAATPWSPSSTGLPGPHETAATTAPSWGAGGRADAAQPTARYAPGASAPSPGFGRGPATGPGVNPSGGFGSATGASHGAPTSGGFGSAAGPSASNIGGIGSSPTPGQRASHPGGPGFATGLSASNLVGASPAPGHGALPPGSPRSTPGTGPLPSDKQPRAPSATAVQAARQALARGNWREAAQHLGALDADADTAALAVRALANLDASAAIYASTEAAARHPLVAGLRYLESLLLLGQGRLADAERAVRQALYLEPTLIVAWLILGRVLRRHGDTAGAVKAWREAEQLCNALPSDAPVPHADGESASRLAEVARGERSRMEAALAAGEELS
ncbi:Chemotaxis protein methyltransferase CheR [Myxococcus hansupus]|uniref:Chemotaxis protein methyltransferase CheR n=1 Tax=Pseudomyxococcus hansupus TaxID=1297742 RepID=A0A0H4X4Q1_9BACT|nr:CheR family methyltransferase [Myxococcus hansupus]AKQ70696.1 Chemotaxis protein methyltransferase CheR [Myxococcus hansupus]